MQKLLKAMRKSSTGIIMVLAVFVACNNQTNDDAATTTAPITETPAPPPAALIFDKLVGTWRSENGRSFERWKKNADGSFHSTVFSIKSGDTVYNEEATIYKENEKWVFANKVRGQNNGKVVKFTSSQLSDITVQFSNPAHDFPTDINYTVPNANTINAFIIGPNKSGGKDTIPFNYSRVQ